MSAIVRAWTAWLRWREACRTPRPDAVQQAEVDRLTREIDRLRTGWREADQYHQREIAKLRASNREMAQTLAARSACSCSGTCVVVIHDTGTYCGDDQSVRLAEVLAKSAATLRFDADTVEADYEQMAATVLDTLRGGHGA